MSTASFLRLASFSIALASSAIGFASQQTFAIGGATSKQSAMVESVTTALTVVGKTSSLKGTLKFDPKLHAGVLVLAANVKSIDTGSKAQNSLLQSKDWLDAAKFPTVTFTTTAIKQVKGAFYNFAGKFTLHGISHNIQTTTNLQYLPSSVQTKKMGFKGNVVQFTSVFPIQLADYGITIKGAATGKLADTVKVTITVSASSM